MKGRDQWGNNNPRIRPYAYASLQTLPPATWPAQFSQGASVYFPVKRTPPISPPLLGTVNFPLVSTPQSLITVFSVCSTLHGPPLHHMGHSYPKHLRLNRRLLHSLPPSQVKELPVCCEEVTEPSRACLSEVRPGVRSKFFDTMWVPGQRSRNHYNSSSQSGQLPSLQSNGSNQAKSQSDESVGDGGIGSQAMPSLHPASPGLALS